MALRLVLSIPLADILAFRKLSRAYFGLLEVLAHNHTSTLAAQVRRCSQRVCVLTTCVLFGGASTQPHKHPCSTGA